MVQKKEEVKIKYSPKEIEILKEKAKKSKKTVNEYQRDISKKANIRIEVKE